MRLPTEANNHTRPDSVRDYAAVANFGRPRVLLRGAVGIFAFGGADLAASRPVLMLSGRMAPILWLQVIR